MTPMKRSRLVAIFASVAILAAGSLVVSCSSDDEVSNGDKKGDTSATTDPADTELKITDVWARTSPKMVSAGAAYLKITNDTDEDDELLGASVDASVAGKVELHETKPVDAAGGGSMDSTAGGAMDSNGDSPTTTAAGSAMMQMVPVDKIEIPSGKTVSLEPGGYHIMLIDLVKPLEVGTTLKITLQFEDAGERVVEADVRDTAP